MDRLSGLLASFLMLTGLPVWTNADAGGMPSRPNAVAPSLGDAATDGSSRQSEWPCRIGVPRAMMREILELWTTSPTFQRQCIRLAGANITVAVGLSPLLRPGLRATSRILRREGQVFFVSTTLRDETHLEEDLPHELEHVMEQIEARDLARDSAAGRGSWSSGPHAYETERARLAGIRAANEVQAARRSHALQPVRTRVVLPGPAH
jgi:hypothetical protein